MSPHRRAAGRWAAAAAAIVASVALVAQESVTTDASWSDREFAHAPIGTVDCAAAEGAFATRGEGRLLSGSLLGIDVDSIAAVDGLVVTNDGTRSVPSTAGAEAADPAPDAYADPLSVHALDAVSVELSGVLQFPMDTDLGLVGQYARASSDGTAGGAAGALTSSGGIALDSTGGYPELATLRVSELLRQINPAVATTLAGVAEVSLVAGAVTGRAGVDGCALAWSGAAGEITRDYLAASLRTDIQTPTVGALVSTVDGAIDAVQLAAEGIGSDAGVTGDIEAGLTSLLNGVLGSSSELRLGDVTVTGLSAEVDLAAARSLASQRFGDGGGVVTVDPAAGTVSVDTAALLATAYPGQYSDGLNGLPPNSNLLSDPATIAALSTALRSAAAAWLAEVQAALAAAVDAAQISASAEVVVQVSTLDLLPVWTDIAVIDVEVVGSLADLRSGTGTASTRLELLGVLDITLTPVLDSLVDAAASGFDEIVGTAADSALSPLSSLPAAVDTLVEAVVAAVSTVYSTLFLDEVVAVIVNAQNDPASGSPEPADWSSLGDGRYDVAALRIGVLGALDTQDARLYLGRGSVGPGCVLAQAPLPCAGY